LEITSMFVNLSAVSSAVKICCSWMLVVLASFRCAVYKDQCYAELVN